MTDLMFVIVEFEPMSFEITFARLSVIGSAGLIAMPRNSSQFVIQSASQVWRESCFTPVSIAV